jgi:hypothetical protein
VESDDVIHTAFNQQGDHILIKSILLALFLLPFVHIGIILSVAIHEVLGHGLSAEVLGGVFSGFSLNWDGMGRAYAFLPPSASSTDRMVFLSSGILATLIAGWLFLGIACAIKKQVGIRLALLILSYCCLMDGIPYLLWNSWNPIGPGDVAKILNIWQQAGYPHEDMMRIVILVVSGIMFIGFTYLFFLLLFQGIESYLWNGKSMSSKARFWSVLLFVVIPGTAGNFTFDWNQVAPGIGSLPTTAGISSVIVSAILIFSFPLKPKATISGGCIRLHQVLLAWLLEGIVILLMIFWLRKGVVIHEVSLQKLSQIFH